MPIRFLDDEAPEAGGSKVRFLDQEETPQAAQEAPEAPKNSPFVEGVGKTMRALITAGGTPVNWVADGVAGARNAATEAVENVYGAVKGKDVTGVGGRMPYMSQVQQEAFDANNVPKPDNVGYTVLEALASGNVLGKLAGAAPLVADSWQKALSTAGGVAASEPAQEAAKEFTGSDTLGMAAGLLASMAGGMAGGKVGAKLDPSKPAQPMTIADIETRAKAAYDVIDKSGVRLQPRSAQSIVSQAENVLKKNHNYDPTVSPRVATVITAMRKSIAESQEVPFNQMEQLRGLASNLRTDPDESIRRLGALLIKELDEGISNVKGTDLKQAPGSTPQEFKKVLDAVKDARESWRIRSKASLLQSVMDDVEIDGKRPTASQGELIRNKFIALEKNKSKMAMFSKEEQAAIKAIASDTKTEKVLAQAARFSPQRTILSGVGGMSAPAFLAGTGNYGAAAAAATTSAGALAADKGLGAIRKGKVDSVIQQVLTGQKVSKEDLDAVRGLFGGAVNLQDR
jgi:hypothetical protein